MTGGIQTNIAARATWAATTAGTNGVFANSFIDAWSHRSHESRSPTVIVTPTAMSADVSVRIHDRIVKAKSAKASAVLRAGLTPIICVGESLAERDAGRTLDVIASQLAGSIPAAAGESRVVVAYEPVWAIGTGRTPTIEQVAEVHGAIGKALSQRFGEAGKAIRLLYGGSVKPDNAKELMAVAGVDGALVGGASLKAVDFLKIAQGAA
mgnify:CR=1 FL=1